MVTSFRTGFAVMVIGTVLVAAAITPAQSAAGRSEDFMGNWITWTGSGDGETPVCRRLYVEASGDAVRSGGWDAPGWNGLVSGALSRGADGRPVLAGEWRDGRIAGAFALTLRDNDALDGTFAAPGAPEPQRWQGRRDDGRARQDLPCTF